MGNTERFDSTMIVTFTCDDRIHVYEQHCGYLPHEPYKVHGSIETATEHLKKRGVSKPEIYKPKIEWVKEHK